MAHYRTLWVSDAHLGTVDAKGAALADFLHAHTCDTLYLVGDMIDGWKIKRAGLHWPQEHSNVVRAVLGKAKAGVRVVYLTGNHDEFLRAFVRFGLHLGGLSVLNETIHTTADGRRLLVTHGDAFDVITRYHAWIAHAGDTVYEATMRVNQWLNRARRGLGLGYWSLSAFAKRHVKTAVNVISAFEDAIAREARRRGADGVVCGHIHHAEIRRLHGIDYYNCGDWVESCTALAEDYTGQIRILAWDWQQAAVALPALPPDESTPAVPPVPPATRYQGTAVPAVSATCMPTTRQPSAPGPVFASS